MLDRDQRLKLQFHIIIKPIIILLSFGIFPSFSAFATSNDSLFSLANKLYQEGQYSKALEFYNKIDSSVEVCELYYNKGNCHFRLQDWGKAALNYERALKINPRFEDAEENLGIVNKRIPDKPSTERRQSLDSLWETTLKNIGPENFALSAWISLIFSCLALSFILCSDKLSFRKIGLISSLVFIPLFILLLSLGIHTKKMILNTHFAIITSPTAEAVTSPDKEGKLATLLHEGTKVRILRIKDSMTEIRLSNGITVWVNSDKYELI